MSDAIHSYFKVNLSTSDAVAMGYLDPRYLTKFDYYCKLSGRFCIRIERPALDAVNPFEYKISYSFCSPQDNFSRKIARSICKSRIDSGCCISIQSEKKLSAKEVTEIAVKLLNNASVKHSTILKTSAFLIGDVHPIKLPNWISEATSSEIKADYKSRNLRKIA